MDVATRKNTREAMTPRPIVTIYKRRDVA